MVIIAMLWIPVVQGAHSLYDYLQQVQGYLAPPIFVVFFFGVFWKRLNAKGCLYAMVAGFILGLFRMLVDTPVTMKLKGFEHGYTQGTFLWIINNINFQYFSIIITLFSAAVMVAVSYATPAPQYAQIKSLTFGTATARRPSQDTRQLGLAGSGGLRLHPALHPRRLYLLPGIVGRFVGARLSAASRLPGIGSTRYHRQSRRD